MISVFVLTLNEEKNLSACLDTLAWSDDVHVLDSGSSDRTVAIAESHGARVWTRKLDNFAAQQNWALETIEFKYPWVLYIDADERVTPELAEAMRAAVASPGEKVAFRIERRDFFLGTWLRHVQMTAFYDRLFRPEKMRYERVVHPLSIVEGEVGLVAGYLDHFPFSKGVADWVGRHNQYSSNEAAQVLANRRAGARGTLRGALFGKDVHEKKRNLKELYYRMPARPLVKFLVMYVGKRGFLDGKAGFAYSVLIAFYEYLIVLKMVEIERGEWEVELPAGVSGARRDGDSGRRGRLDSR